MTQNQIAYHNAKELARHNLASEIETARHQAAQEKLQDVANKIANRNVTVQKEHYERMDAINATHYSNMDAYNAAALAETQRANQAQEQLKAQQNAINAAALSETARHQRVTEGIESSLAANTIHRTQYEISHVMPVQTDYIRSQTQAQWAQWQKTQTELRSYPTTVQHTEADTALKEAQATTEQSRQFLNYSSGIQSLYSTIQSALGNIAVAFGM